MSTTADNSKNITVLGAGSWGTAMACVMARQGHTTTLWGRDDEVVSAINNRAENPKYLPNISLPKTLKATIDFDHAVVGAEIILIVTPAQSIGAISQILSATKTKADLVLCAKGIDRNTGKLPADTLKQYFPNAIIGALSGPSFSADVAKGLPTAVTLGCETMDEAQRLSEVLSDPAFRVYASDDLTGVELGGALKNVIALAIGVCRGMQLGASAEAALIARGFAELSRLSVALGASSHTLTGLSGLGDLVLTCSSPQSRNFSYGINLGKGKSLDGLPLAEGAFTAAIAEKIAKENQVDCPIIQSVAKLVSGAINPKQAVEQLLARPLKQEQQ